MVNIGELVEVKDNSSDAELQALRGLVEACGGKAPDWRSLRQDFTGKDWKPMLHIVPQAEFPFHAYAVYRGEHAEREGQYAARGDAERCAMEYASMCNSNHVTPRDL